MAGGKPSDGGDGLTPERAAVLAAGLKAIGSSRGADALSEIAALRALLDEATGTPRRWAGNRDPYEIRPTGICCTNAVIAAAGPDGSPVVVNAEPDPAASVAIIETVDGRLIGFVGANPKAPGPRFRLHEHTTATGTRGAGGQR